MEMNVEQPSGRQETRRVSYPANSRKGKTEETRKPKIESVVTSPVSARKQSVGGRFLHSFISEDGGSVTQYVVMEVLLPAFKNMLSDGVSKGVERLLFGDAHPSRSGRTGYTNYSPARRIPGSPYNDPRPPLSRQARTTHNFDDIIISSRAEAEDVLDRLRDLINEYEVATVSDLYDLVGLTGEFTDDKWGWYDLRSASVQPIRGGYLLRLPRTQSIV